MKRDRRRVTARQLARYHRGVLVDLDARGSPIGTVHLRCYDDFGRMCMPAPHFAGWLWWPDRGEFTGHYLIPPELT